jgi:hypothetical protein
MTWPPQPCTALAHNIESWNLILDAYPDARADLELHPANAKATFKSRMRLTPIPLSPKQVEWAQDFDFDFQALWKCLSSSRLQLAALSFLYRLMLARISHREMCPSCGQEERTSHLVFCPGLPRAPTLWSDLLSPPYDSTTVLMGVELWSRWLIRNQWKFQPDLPLHLHEVVVEETARLYA